jgi:hypothetical protein
MKILSVKKHIVVCFLMAEWIKLTVKREKWGWNIVGLRRKSSSAL